MYSSSSLSPRGLGLSSESMSGSSAISLNTPTNELKFGLQFSRDSQDAGPLDAPNPDNERSSSETSIVGLGLNLNQPLNDCTSL